MLSRRRILSIAVLLAAAPLAASAQTAFPSKPLRIVVPNAPGGAADQTARAVGQKMSQGLGQPVVIDNKPGAGGVVAGDMVAKAAPDGHTLLLISSGTAVSASLFKTLPFDTVADFTPVAQLASFDLVIVVPTVDANAVTPHSESFQAVVWHGLVSHPRLMQQANKWEGLERK